MSNIIKVLRSIFFKDLFYPIDGYIRHTICSIFPTDIYVIKNATNLMDKFVDKFTVIKISWLILSIHYLKQLVESSIRIRKAELAPPKDIFDG